MLSIRRATAADLDALIATDHVATHRADRREAIAEWEGRRSHQRQCFRLLPLCYGFGSAA